MAIEKVVSLRVQDDFTKTEMSVKSLRAQIREATANVAIMSEKFGATSREATEAAKRAAELKDQMGDALALTDAFNPDAKFKALTGALAGVAGGFSAYQGLLGVAGVENAELEKQILKVQAAMAVTQGLQTIGESVDTFKQLGAVIKSTAAGQAVLTAAQSAYTFVVGASTTALRALRVALISTGVGALVVGVGMLIANFEKISSWVSNLTEKFGGWRNVLLMVSAPIWAIVKALEAMGVIESEAEEKSRKADEARAARKAEQAKKLLADQKRIGDYYDFEIAKAEAAGKSTFELEQKKRDAILKTAFAYNEATRAIIQSGKATEEQIKAWNENQALIIKLQQEGILAQTKAEKEKNDQLQERAKEYADKRAEAQRKELEERLRRERENHRQLLEELRAFNEAIAQANREQTDSRIAAEVAKDEYLKSLRRLSKEQEIEEEYQRGREILEAGNATQQERLNFEIEFIRRRDALKREKEAERIAAEKALSEAELEHKREVVQASLDLSASFGQTLQNLAGKNKAVAKIGIVIENAAAIARIVQNTAVANAKAVAAFPLSGGQPWVGINIASGVLGIANTIAATRKALSQIGEGGESGGAPSMSASGGAAPAAPQFNVVGQNPNNQLAATIAGQQGQPIRTYVVGQEVTTQQSLDRQIRSTATFNS